MLNLLKIFIVLGPFKYCYIITLCNNVTNLKNQA